MPKLLAGCSMHARRPFVQALEARDSSAIFFVERFQKVSIPPSAPGSDELLPHVWAAAAEQPEQ